MQMASVIFQENRRFGKNLPLAHFIDFSKSERTPSWVSVIIIVLYSSTVMMKKFKGGAGSYYKTGRVSNKGCALCSTRDWMYIDLFFVLWGGSGDDDSERDRARRVDHATTIQICMAVVPPPLDAIRRHFVSSACSEKMNAGIFHRKNRKLCWPFIYC